VQLKPRSARANRQRQSSSTKGNLFGDAKPREEILQKRGVDVQTIDSKFERKAAVLQYTPDQEEQLEAVREQLETASQALREANEQELPEEAFRVAEDAKRKELNALLEQFAKANLESPPAGVDDRHYTSTRRNSDHHHHAHHGGGRSYGRKPGRHGDDYDDQYEDNSEDPAFSSFSSNTRRRRSEGHHA